MTEKFSNRNATNRKSPKNEDDYIYAYLELNPEAKKSDDLDIAAVKTVNGEYGHGLLKQSFNRAKDTNVHHVEAFIPDSVLRNQMKK